MEIAIVRSGRNSGSMMNNVTLNISSDIAIMTLTTQRILKLQICK